MATLSSLDSGTIDEFIAHPDYRQVSAFFLGAVFITSLQYSTTWFRGFIPRIGSLISRYRSKPTDIEESNFEKTSIAPFSKPARSGEHQSLVFTLSICFAFASIAYFGSLLSFSISEGGALCAFVVAWGGMAAQTSRIVGLAILLLDLRDLGIPRMEFYAIIGWLFLGMVLVFINNAIGTGVTRTFEPLSVAFCYRKHFLPTALVSSLLYFILETYTLFRLVFLIKPDPSRQCHRWSKTRDIRIGRAGSLLLLELLTVVPSAKHFSILADFIPLSIGALIVLATFNMGDDAQGDSRSRSGNSTSQRPDVISLGMDGRVSRLSFTASQLAASQRSDVASVGHDGRVSRVSHTAAQRGSPADLPSSTARPMISHPYSAESLNDPTSSQEYTWLRQNQQHMPGNDSDIVIRTEEGIIQVVELAKAPTHPGAVVLFRINRHGSPLSTPRPTPGPSLRHDLASGSTSTIVSPTKPPAPRGPSPISPPAKHPPPGPSPMSPPTNYSPPAPSPMSPPTSILLHPWHRRKQPDSMPESPTGSSEADSNKTLASANRGSVRTSYSFEYMIHMPPAPEQPDRLRRYTSYTLTSPMASQEGEESRTPVRLLNFESNLRANEGRPRSALLSPPASTLPR